MRARLPGDIVVTDYEQGIGLRPGTRADTGPQEDARASGPPWLAATLPALDLAAGSVQSLRRAARRAGATGAMVDAPLDLSRVAASFCSERLLRIDGHEIQAFAPMSGFFRCADGWVRTHANYPHHTHRLLVLFGLLGPGRTGSGDGDGLTRALSSLGAQEVEDAALAGGAVAVRVRTPHEWRATEAGRAAASGPLVRTTLRDDAADHRPLTPGGAAPLAGLRVLDLTRVVAGPVATRDLALLGAHVLRIDPPVPAEIRWLHLDTGQGKHSALLDLTDDGDLTHAQALLDGADVLVTGYRPGAAALTRLKVPPGVVHARVSAWGQTGPWGTRRGFDSIVQAATGIAVVESPGEPSDADAPEAPRPGALPAQVLDHATGHLLAAGIVDALAARACDGRGRDVSVSLARTASWLLDAPGRDPSHAPPAALPRDAVVSHGHRPQVTSARPPFPGTDHYPAPAHPWGTDHARW